jgi:flagellar biosynthesis protein FlhF
MKMKLFSAPTMDEAMALVRAELGPDAVILSTRDEDGAVEIRAAVERSFNHRFAAPRFSEPKPFLFDAARDQLSATLRWHGASDGFVHLVSEAGGRLGAGLELLGSLAAGLEGVLSFQPLQARTPKSVLLVGPYGSGKTLAAAKLALHLRHGASRLDPLSADFDASGQTARLAAFMLKASVPAALTPEALVRLVREADDSARRLVIDAPPFNPLDASDMKRLNDLISFANVEPVLVLSAEGHPMDLEDNARAFAAAGVRRVILTRLDTVRRRGGAIAAISSARLSIAQLGAAPNAKCGLAPASATEVARLFVAGRQEAELLKGAA